MHRGHAYFSVDSTSLVLCNEVSQSYSSKDIGTPDPDCLSEDIICREFNLIANESDKNIRDTSVVTIYSPSLF